MIKFQARSVRQVVPTDSSFYTSRSTDKIVARLEMTSFCEGCPIHPHCNGPYYPCHDPYGP